MENKMRTILQLLKEGYEFVELIRHRFPRKVHAVRIPLRRGFYQRKEDKEVMNTLKRLCKYGNSSRVKTLILHGPTGHGKKHCAANLMDQLYTKPVRSRFFWNKPWNFRNRPTVLWTINATNKETMLESFCSLAKEIGLTKQAKAANQELSLFSRTSEGRQYHMNLQNQCQENAYDKPLKQIYEEVMKTLRRQGSWVLLIEGAKEDRSSQQQFWPSTGDLSLGNGLVIMTTEDSKLLQEEGDDYPLAKVFIGKMTKEDAFEFLAKKSGIPFTVAERFANLVHFIPQDIAKFGAFMREYQEETNRQLNFENLPVPPRGVSFPEYFIMMMELTRENQTQLLKFLACCSSENCLPLEILCKGITGPLEQANFEKFVNLSVREEIKVVTLHPSEHTMLRDILCGQSQSDTEKTWTYTLKFCFWPKKPRNVNIPTLSCLDVSHVIKCLSEVCKDALQNNTDIDFKLMRFVLPHLKEAVKLKDKLKLEGEYDPVVMANGHACLGEGLLIFGRPEEARENLTIALDLFKNYDGQENVQLDLENVWHLLGKAHSNRFGDFMRKYQEETNRQPNFENLPPKGVSFPEYFTMMMELTRENQTQLLKFLACCSSENYLPLEILDRGITGPLERANFRKFVECSTREEIKVVTIHPREHTMLRDILSVQSRSVTEKTWTYVLKIPFLQNKPRNTPTLSCLDVSHVIKCLSEVCKDALQNNRNKDFKLMRFVLPHLKEAVKLKEKLKLEGEFDPLVMANGHACLGEGLLIFGRPEEAWENLKIALDLFKNYEGQENVQLDLANVWHFLGEAHSNSHLASPWQRKMYLEIALQEKKRFYKGEDHPQIALTLRSLGNVLNELGKHTKAINLIQRALKIYDGKENFKQEYGYTLSALGSSYRYLGQYAEAEDYLKMALKIFESVESPSELRIGVTLSRLASVQRNMDKLDESIASLDMAHKKFGYNDIYSAVILSKLSVVYRYKANFKRSLQFALKAKKIADDQYGTKSHPARATALLNLGHALSDVGDVDDAVRSLTEALDINKKIHGSIHRTVAANCNYLSYGYLQMGMIQQAKKELLHAIEVMHHYSRSHPERANSLKRLSKVCLILGETVKSADLADRALQIYKQTHGDTMEHREVRRGAVRVAYACSKLGLSDMAEEYLKEVELGFPMGQEIRSHPEFAALLRKKTEITLDSFEFNWPLNEVSVQEILSRANKDLLQAEEILSYPFRFKQQIALTKKEKARLSILMGNYGNAYNDIRSALNILPRYCDYLKADFSLIRSDAERGLNLVNRSKVSLETAENIYRNIFGDDHPMVAVTLQKQCSLHLDFEHKSNTGKNEAHKYFEASHQACEVLKSNLEQQLAGIQTDFLGNFSFDQHPILKRQNSLDKRLTRNQGAW